MTCCCEWSGLLNLNYGSSDPPHSWKLKDGNTKKLSIGSKQLPQTSSIIEKGYFSLICE
jgi:hypothetical protein